jgi:hypothetical protein
MMARELIAMTVLKLVEYLAVQKVNYEVAM